MRQVMGALCGVVSSTPTIGIMEERYPRPLQQRRFHVDSSHLGHDFCCFSRVIVNLATPSPNVVERHSFFKLPQIITVTHSYPYLLGSTSPPINPTISLCTKKAQTTDRVKHPCAICPQVAPPCCRQFYSFYLITTSELIWPF